ncbi:hypothetical protein KBB96_15590 [Luteolibacter ambystomatis]|uniref:Uncharacterized protein n=1 Tax=Luteolibacter ambystomatis TaxID=2824561 RepID=A0A975G6L7_9BACT|nr:hypothetical protein [Luteolibacter ambystomatis]QUE50284.1 hypothetical protein KBB96_15590 [Luteolibacter ambystomatis]
MFRPSYENDLQANLLPVQQQVAQAAPAAVMPVAAAPVAAEIPAPVVAEEPAFKDEPNAEFQSMIEAREQKMTNKRKRQSVVLTLVCLAALGSFGTWCAVSPTAKAKIATFKTAMAESKRDLKTLGSITKQYDKSLEKIAVHSGDIDSATRAIGGDPTAVDKSGDPSMEKEMQEFGGDGTRSTTDRNRDLKSKFGMVQKLAQQNGVAPTPNVTPGQTTTTTEGQKQPQ